MLCDIQNSEIYVVGSCSKTGEGWEVVDLVVIAGAKQGCSSVTELAGVTHWRLWKAMSFGVQGYEYIDRAFLGRELKFAQRNLLFFGLHELIVTKPRRRTRLTARAKQIIGLQKRLCTWSRTPIYACVV